MTRHAIAKGICLLVVLQLLANVSPAFAGPANQACVGRTVASHAGPEWGKFQVSFAQEWNYPGDQPGLGDEIYYLRNGDTPDFILENYCNDEAQVNDNDRVESWN